jgi:perosamine synthetase
VRYAFTESKVNLRVPKLGIYDLREEAEHLFQFMKSASTNEALWSRALILEDEEFSKFRLIPISKIHENNPNTILKLMELRNSNIHLWLGASIVTLESTKKWLKELVLENHQRILFWVIDEHETIHGHIGVWIKEDGIFEIDNVIKDSSSAVKGLFSNALITVCKWLHDYTGLSNVFLRVLSTNSHAINFYKKNKFVEAGQQELKDKNQNSSDISSFWVVMKLELNLYYDVPKVILTAGPSIGPFEVSLVSDAVRTGWNSNHSDYLNLFSETFANYVGAKYAIPTDSCTSALHLALWAIGVGPGDEVIVPEVTWVATANVVRYLGAKPVFAEIDPLTWTIDPTSTESLITEKTKAIVPVHLYGFVADLDPIEILCKKYNLRLIQDAAPGIGSMYKSAGVAERGDFTCFSFQGAKLLVTGEGGVLTTNNEELYERAFKISDTGRKPGTFWIEKLGKKMKMNNITAALGLAQMQGVERQILKKRLIRDWYAEEFSKIQTIQMQKELENTRSICWMTSINISLEGFSRDGLREFLSSKNIDTRPVFPPISQYPIWDQDYKPQIVSKLIGDNSINLPSGVGLSRSAISKIGAEIRSYISKV